MSVNLTPAQQRNADAVRRMYACERAQDLAGWIALWHPEGRHTLPWDDDVNDVVGIEALRASTAHKFATRSNVVIHDEVWPMAEPEWVFATLSVSIFFTELGRTVAADLWCRFRFDPNGLILEYQEVGDTARVQAQLKPGIGQPE